MHIRSKSARQWFIYAIFANWLFAGLIGCRVQNSDEKRILGVIANPPEITIQLEPGDDTTKEREVIFELQNKTDRAVQILQMISSCSCTVAKQPSSSTIEPGGNIEIGVSVSMPRTGAQSATVTIETDCPQTPMVLLSVIARGLPTKAPFLSTRTNDLHVVVRDSNEASAEAIIDTVEASKDDAWLCDFSTTDPLLSVEYVASENLYAFADGNFAKRYRVHVKATESKSENNEVAGWLKFRSVVPGPTELPAIPVYFKFEKALTVAPSAMVFERSLHKPYSLSQKLVLLSRDEEEWSCEPIDVPAFVKVTPDIGDGNLPGFAKRFDISLVEDLDGNPQNTRLMFKTSLSSAKSVVVPLEIRELNGVD